MEYIELKQKVRDCGEYDIIVAGGGVAGVAAALSARRHGVKKVLLVEKTVNIGGLATTGLINMFTPMCNGKGVKIMRGMADEFFWESVRYGWDTVTDEWKDGKEPGEGAKTRFMTRYSPWIFSFRLTEMLKEESVDIFLDTVIVDALCENGHVNGLVLESKSGREYYRAKYIVDATGDCDVFKRAGAPTVEGKNYFTYVAHKISVESCQKVVETQNIRYAMSDFMGGEASLYGKRHREDKPKYVGVTKEDVTEYVVDNQLILFDKIKDDDRKSRDVVQIPFMPQFRTTRHLKADYSMTEDDVYKHHEDSVCAICDFDNCYKLYEVPLRTMINSDYDNIIAVGRCASAEGYTWDVLRVIPSAILTGQASGVVLANCLENNTAVKDTNIKAVQEMLEADNVMIHFDDKLVPEDKTTVYIETEGHI